MYILYEIEYIKGIPHITCKGYASCKCMAIDWVSEKSDIRIYVHY